MTTSNINQVIARRRPALFATFASVLAAGGLMASAAHADGARDLTVEQTAMYTVQATAPAASVPSGALSVVAWVDHADNTYAVGEAVRLYVRSNKDAYVTVLNVGPSGNTTMLFPNAAQRDARVGAMQVVEIPGPGSGASIRVGGPVGRELIKVIASTSPAPLFDAAKLSGAGPFATVSGGSRSVARDLAVTMGSQPSSHEWDDYNKVITTIASRPVSSVVPLMPAPSGQAWPVSGSGLRIATDKSRYRMGETVTVYASSTVPCYLTLVNIGSSGQARVLLPNAAQPRNYLAAGQTVVFPGVRVRRLTVTPVGPAGVETVTAVCSADNRPVVASDLVYAGGAVRRSLGAAGMSSSRDLAVVAAEPGRQASHATVGFLVTQ